MNTKVYARRALLAMKITSIRRVESRFTWMVPNIYFPKLLYIGKWSSRWSRYALLYLKILSQYASLSILFLSTIMAMVRTTGQIA